MLLTFNASDNKKIQKFSGHPVAVSSMVFSGDGQYVLSSGVGERYVVIWKLGSGAVTALDRANAEDAILPLPKLHTQEKKRKHDVTKPSDDTKPAFNSDLGTTARLIEKRVPVQRIEDDSVCIKDMMRQCGVIDTRVNQGTDGHPGMPTSMSSDLFGSISIKTGANTQQKDSNTSKIFEVWGCFQTSREFSICKENKVDKDASDVSEPPSEEMQDAAAAPSEEEEEDEEIDEMVYGEDADSS